jgi:hypothetical protein
MNKPYSVEPTAFQPIESALDAAEERDLGRMESTIAANLAAFFQVGFALMEIKRRRLYRAEFRSFEEYCRTRWEFNRAHAYRLIGAAEVCKSLSPIGDIPLPENECQIRPLIGLAPSTATKAWKRACEAAGSNGRITGALVHKAVGEVTKNRKTDAAGNLRQNWQILVEPLLNKALQLTRTGDQDAVAETVDKISLLLIIGRRQPQRDAEQW